MFTDDMRMILGESIVKRVGLKKAYIDFMDFRRLAIYGFHGLI